MIKVTVYNNNLKKLGTTWFIFGMLILVFPRQLQFVIVLM